MGDIGTACEQRGAVWSAVSTHKRILEWAAAASTANVIHIATTAWQESIRILIALVPDEAIDSQSRTFNASLDDMVGALGKLRVLPKSSLPSAVGPVSIGQEWLNGEVPAEASRQLARKHTPQADVAASCCRVKNLNDGSPPKLK